MTEVRGGDVLTTVKAVKVAARMAHTATETEVAKTLITTALHENASVYACNAPWSVPYTDVSTGSRLRRANITTKV